MYIGGCFKYTEAFTCLQITMLTCTGLQELRILSPFEYPLTANWPLCLSISQPQKTIKVSTRTRRKFNNSTIKVLTCGISWIQWCQTTRYWKVKGVHKINNFSKDKAYLKLSTSKQKLISYRLQVWFFTGIIKDFYFQCSSSFNINKRTINFKYLVWALSIKAKV